MEKPCRPAPAGLLLFFPAAVVYNDIKKGEVQWKEKR